MAAYKFQYLFSKPSRFPQFNLWHDIKPGATRDVVFKLCEIANSAVHTFTGAHPMMWPFSPDHFAKLPWYDEWWQTEGNTSFLKPGNFKRICKDLKPITAEIVKAAEENGDGLFSPFGHAWCSKKLAASKRGLISGHAAQTLMCADSALGIFLGEDAYQDEQAFLLSCAYENLILVHMECQSLLSEKTAMARQGGLARHRRDPKSQDKEFVKSCWRAWCDAPNLYNSVESFARDMLEKTEHLEGNTQVIARWVRGWKKDLLLSK